VKARCRTLVRSSPRHGPALCRPSTPFFLKQTRRGWPAQARP
jgi:hypothetical protein